MTNGFWLKKARIHFEDMVACLEKVYKLEAERKVKERIIKELRTELSFKDNYLKGISVASGLKVAIKIIEEME